MTQTKQDPIQPDSVWYGTGPHQMWPPLVQHWIKQNLTSFGMVQDPIKLDIICCDTGPSQFFLCLERYKILSNLTLLEQYRTLSNSVAKPELELVKPMQIIWDLEPETEPAPKLYFKKNLLRSVWRKLGWRKTSNETYVFLMVLLLQHSFKLQNMAGAGVGAGVGAKNK